MKANSTHYNFNNSLKVKLFIQIYIFEFILFFLGMLTTPSNYGLYLIAYFALIFISFLFIHYMKSRIIYNRLFVFASIYSLFLLFLGFINSWELRDILGDSARFLAPLLSYSLGMVLLRTAELSDYEKLVDGIVKFFTYLVIINFAIKLYKMFILNEPLFVYSTGGVGVELFLFGYCILMISSKTINLRTRLLYFGILLCYVSDPILSMSKSGSLVLISVTMLYLYKFSNMKMRFIFISLIGLITLYLVREGINSGVIKRFSDALIVLSSINSSNVSVDYSTFTRIAEVQGAIYGMSNAFYYPFSYIFGLGSGATWFPQVNDLGTGLDVGNYRPGGGVHHIHIEIVSLVFRHGLIGLFLYLFFLIYTLKKSLALSFSIKADNHKLHSMLGSISICCIGAGTYMLTDTSIYGHFSFGLLAAITHSFTKIYNTSRY